MDPPSGQGDPWLVNQPYGLLMALVEMDGQRRHLLHQAKPLRAPAES